MSFSDWFALFKEGGALVLLAWVLFVFQKRTTDALDRLARILYRVEGALGMRDEGTPPPRDRRHHDND
jgi:hypothetical protein